MKNSLILLFIMMLSTNSITAQYFPVDTAKLNTSYRALANEKDNLEFQKAFFDAFPNTWRQFIMTYQFSPNDNYNLTMYSIASDHITEGLRNLTTIDDSTYCNKLVHLTIGGIVLADAPNYFKSTLHKAMYDRMDAMLTTISKLRKGDQMLFWEFYWSSCIKNKPAKTQCNRLTKINSDVYPEVIKIMKIAYDFFSNDRMI